MDRPGIPSESLRFGLFELDLAARSVTRKGVPVRLQDQPFLVLTLLLERPGDIVTREELRQRLWPDGTYVDFDGSLNAVLKRLRAALGDDPDQPRFIETVPKRGYRFIAPVTRVPKTEPAPDPADAPGISPSHEDTPMPGGARRRPGVLFGALAILLILGTASLWLGRAKAPDSAHAELKPIAARRSVAVLGFQNNSGNSEDAWLSTALSQMLSTELAAGENLRLVSGEDVAGLRASSPWSSTDTLGKATTSRLGTALNSDWLVLGSYAVAGEPGRRKLRLDARLQDAATGEIVAELAETGSDQDPFAIVSRLGGQMRDRLGIPPVNEGDRPALLASLPSNGEAARFYAQGLMKLREFDALAAKDLLLQAIAVDPKFPLAHSMLAQAWGQLGYDARSREEAKTALDLSADLPRADRMVVEGAYYESLADPEKAVATWRALLTLFPDSLEYGLRLVAMLDRVGRYEEALETIAQLRRLRPPAGDDARLDLWESREISHRSGPDAEAPLQRGLSKAAARGQKLIYADGKVAQCAALQYSDHPGDAFAPCQEAYDTFLAAGNRARATDALRHLADLTSQQGRRDEALPIYDRAIRMARQTGSRSMLAAAQNNMAILLESQGELDRAEAMFRDVRKTFEEVGDALNVLTALDNIGDIQLARGDLRTSEKTFQEVIARMTPPDRDGYPYYRLASLHLLQGRVGEARREAEQAIAMFTATGSAVQYRSEALMVLGEVLQAGGDLDGARREFQQSLDTRVKLGDAVLIASSRASLASLSIEEGHPSEGEAAVREALSEFEKEKDVVDLVGGYIDLSRASLMLSRMDEAHTAILQAATLARANPDPALKYAVTIQDARVKGAATDAPAAPARGRDALSEARRQLQSVIAEARRLGYVSFACEARLALGEIEIGADSALGRSDLEALAREAHARGLELISRKAAEILNQRGRQSS